MEENPFIDQITTDMKRYLDANDIPYTLDNRIAYLIGVKESIAQDGPNALWKYGLRELAREIRRLAILSADLY